MFDDRGPSDLHYRTPEPPLLTAEPTPPAAESPAPEPRRREAPRAPAPAVAPFLDDELPTSFYRRRRTREASTTANARARRADTSAAAGPRPEVAVVEAEAPRPRRREPSARPGDGQATVLLPSSKEPAAAAVVDDGTVILPGRATPAHVDAVTDPVRRRGSARRDPAREIRALIEALLQRRGALAAAVGVAAIGVITCALSRGDEGGCIHQSLAHARSVTIAIGSLGGG